MKILVALYMKFICPAVAQPPYSTWDKVIVLGASTTYALKLKSSSKYILFKSYTKFQRTFFRDAQNNVQKYEKIQIIRLEQKPHTSNVSFLKE